MLFSLLLRFEGGVKNLVETLKSAFDALMVEPAEVRVPTVGVVDARPFDIENPHRRNVDLIFCLKATCCLRMSR